MNKTNITCIADCYGCGVCSKVCGKKLIDVRLNDKGFYQPYIDNQEACVECGLCLEVCACSHKELSLVPSLLHTYAAWSNNDEIRERCSSGGVAYEIAESLINAGYKAVLARYNVAEGHVEHYIATNISELVESAGSKYLQSYTQGALSNLDSHSKYLFTGTPCQVDSMRRYAKRFNCEDNFVFLDFFCHGVPSYLMWNKYMHLQSQKIENITDVAWRNKKFGWHDSWCMTFKNNNGDELNSRLTKGDIFYKLFLGDFCMNPACTKNCKYKYLNSSADIRVGDCWGHKYRNDHRGVSSVVAFTARGKDVLESLQNVSLIPQPVEVVCEVQAKKNFGNAVLVNVARLMLKSKSNYPQIIWRLIIVMESVYHLPRRTVKKIVKMYKNKY